LNKLRNLGIAMLTLIVLVSVAGIIFAFAELWTISISLLFSAVVVSVVTSLLATRYIARNARTGEQRTKEVVQKLSARVNRAMKQQTESMAELRELIEPLVEAQNLSVTLTQTLQSELDTKVTELETTMKTVGKDSSENAKSTKRHVTSTVRDSTRQIESLVHLFQRYPDVKLPMPSTGAWAIDSQALAHMLALIEERQPRRILELGSGTSTIWIGYLCQTFGGELITLDHLEHYLGLTRTAINRHQLNDVIDSRLAPLVKTEVAGESFDWYDTASLADLTDIDLVIIDGPPAATGPQARYPALPKVIELLSPNATVVLDDAHRPDEARIVDSWLADYPDFQEIERGTSRLAVLQRRLE